MSSLFDLSKRQVLPRWYPFSVAKAMGDTLPTSSEQSVRPQENELSDKIKDWRRHKTWRHAIDIVGTLLSMDVFDDEIALEAAQFVIGQAHNVSRLSMDIATQYVNGGEQNSASDAIFGETVDLKREVTALKQAISDYPRNAIAWADLAYYYTLIGQHGKASHAMECAVYLGRNNRFVIRSAARCYLHLDDPERALQVVRKSDLVKRDPWLMSAEIAISETIDVKAHYVKQGIQAIQDDNLSFWSTNELAATLSTLEFRHGAIRKAKRLMNRALTEPNENTMAQAEWLSKTASGFERSSQVDKVPATFEADTRRYYAEGRVQEAFDATKKWWKYQPFSSMPVTMATYLAAVGLRDNRLAVNVAESACGVIRDSALLLNNHAFALASDNRIDEAKKVLEKVNYASADQRELYSLTATKGLIKFRSGDINAARLLYKEAIVGLRGLKEEHGAVIASFFLVREEVISGNPNGRSLLQAVREQVERLEIKELVSYCDVLLLDEMSTTQSAPKDLTPKVTQERNEKN